jgi:hypothetical protein
MLCTADIDMAKSVTYDAVDIFLDNTEWAICSTYHAVLKASPILFVADWHKIGEHRQSLTDCSNQRKNNQRIDYDYKVGGKAFIEKEGILCKAESKHDKEPWTITTVHTNGTIRIQCRTKTERLNIQRVIPLQTK